MPTASRAWNTRLFTAAVLLGFPAALCAQAQPHPEFRVDSDHDGVSDALEARLLHQFAPHFMVGAHDCSVEPAEFKPGVPTPEVAAENGTIYGQVFPVKGTGDHDVLAELHFYHLWRTDCGRHGHPLDTEHVAVLVQASDTHLGSATWKALYWYAGAHENTVCDVSQIARASTVQAEDHGATVWISPGKHASYLNETLCQRGCGADRCESMGPLATPHLIDLGETDHPMNGSLFIDSPAWPLREKMSSSNFPAQTLARVDTLPASDIAWFNPGRHPMQGVIAHSSTTEQALATSGSDTLVAISVSGDSTGEALGKANNSTGEALSAAGSSTGGALGKSYRNTRHALSNSVKGVGKALHAVDGSHPEQTTRPDE